MIATIAKRLKEHSVKTLECVRGVRAAVVIPIFENSGTHIVLTKRSDKVRFHKGEVSFPGGMYEEKDHDTMSTALRECSEEIGVDIDDVKIIGRIDDFHTITGFVVTPYVGIIPYPYTFTVNPDEVASIILLPYGHLRKASPVTEQTDYNGKTHSGPAIYYNGDRIWGATCKMLLQFRRIVEHEEA